MLRASPLVLLAACSFNAPGGQNTGDDVPDIDARVEDDAPIEVDAPPDAPVDPLCFGTIALTHVCLEALPTGPLVFQIGDMLGSSAGSIATGSDPICAPLRAGSPAVCVVAGTTITIDRRVGTFGDRPIVFLATAGTITITANGAVDASSARRENAGERGPGALVDNASCPTGTAPGARGGGAGGSLGTAGGNGGQSSGPGGIAGAAINLGDTWRGGCPGQSGKDANGAAAGAGGIGGGAIGFIATGAISVAGSVNASGGRGRASAIAGGGGGGGSGGLIVLDTSDLTATGHLYANGGGGAGGSSIGLADGGDGGETNGVTPGPGGPPGGSSGGGGAGSSGVGGQPGNPSTLPDTAGGGGGGGGDGIIHTTDPTPPTGGTYSPAFR